MFEARPPAKVNLALEVVGRRDDGYHDLRSIFLRIGLSDRLTMELGTGAADRLTVTGLPGVTTEGNLVLKALEALRRHVGVDMPPLDVTLDKQIPAAAGLGGGSSDSASALSLAQECWGIGLAAGEEMAVAASLGSDVPFFSLDVPVASIHGRGERAVPLPAARGDVGLLLVTPPTSLSTAAVFERYDELDARRGARAPRQSGELLTELESGLTGPRLAAWAPLLRDANDLWDAAASLALALPVLRAALERETEMPFLLSGSGPTLFAIYASVEEASVAGQLLVESRVPELESAIINAVDMTGPEPKWRFP